MVDVIDQTLLRALAADLREVSDNHVDEIGWVMGPQAYNEWFNRLRPIDQEKAMDRFAQYYALDPEAGPFDVYSRFI